MTSDPDGGPARPDESHTSGEITFGPGYVLPVRAVGASGFHPGWEHVYPPHPIDPIDGLRPAGPTGEDK